MSYGIKLLVTVAMPMLIFGAEAHASAVSKGRHRDNGHAANDALIAQLKSLETQMRNQREEIASLRTEVEGERAAVGETGGRVQATESALQSTRDQVQAVQAQVNAAPTASKEEVDAQIANAIDKEHHASQLYFKGITIQPGGFLELAGIYRQHFQGNDIASSFAVPFPSNHASHTAEGRFTARQSRLSFLAEGEPNKQTTLSMYGEFDFQGGAQTANSNQSNSYNPRIRVLYGTADWAEAGWGLHLLAGQSWSLLTMQAKGIVPRAEAIPSVVDASYVPGFAWARQPGVRLSGDFFDHKLWVAASVENPATTVAGTVPTNVTYNQTAGSGFDSANSLSLNHVPDVIGKVVYDDMLAGHALHVEGFGIYRSFDDHLDGAGNASAHGGGFGANADLQIIPKGLDIQFSGFKGRGIGRYGSAGLPDVTFSSDGRIHPIREIMLLTGLNAHPTSRIDMFVYAGEEQEQRKNLGAGYGIGLETANDSGCFVEGGACAGNTRRVRQLTGGVWNKFYQGSFGRAQVGLVYSYTQRQLFEGIGGMPQVGNNMGFLSFRYYPF